MRVDVAVVGLGAIGSAALWRLAARGARVAGFERFAVGHPFGSSHGRTRLFREACLEHPGLVEVARLSRALFAELAAETGGELLSITGGLMIGAPDSDVVAGTLAAADAGGLDVTVLGADELRHEYPQHAGVGDDDVAVLDPGAGYTVPEATIVAAVARARALGATVVENARVLGVEAEAGQVTVSTAEGTWQAERVVLSTGAWLAAMAPSLALRPIRTPLTWFAPRAGGFGLERFPVFVRQRSATDVLWGHGAVGDDLVKVGMGDLWEQRRAVDPDHLDRGIQRDDWSEVSARVAEAIPGLDPAPARVEPCMITVSPDGQFVVGASPSSDRIHLAGGDSGHAFKHAPALGELIARDLAGEDTGLDVDFLRPARLRSAGVTAPTR